MEQQQGTNSELPNLAEWVAPSKSAALPDTRVTLVSAPAGFGKSCLAASWYRDWKETKYWLQLSLADNQLDHFVERLSPLLSLDWDKGQLNASAVALSRCLQAVRQYKPSRPILLVLDDLHHLNHPDVLQVIKAVLGHPGFRCIICSRVPHRDLLTPLVISRQLSELGQTHLRLENAQIHRLLSHLPEPPSDRWITEANQHLQGWPAMWAMVKYLLESGQTPAELRFDLLSADLADYLINETVTPLPPQLADTLFSLVVLERFDVPLASQVSGQPMMENKLHALSQYRLFLQPDQDKPEQMRIAPFYRDALQHYLAVNDPQRLEIAHHAAFRELMARDRWHEAALSVQACQSKVLAKQWLIKAGWKAYHRALYPLLETLFSFLTESDVHADEELALLYAWWQLEGRKDCATAAEFIDTLSVDSMSPTMRARFRVVEAEYRYQFDEIKLSFELAERAYPELTRPHDKMSAGFTMAMSRMWLGDFDAADADFERLAPFANTKQQLHVSLAIKLRRAQLSMFRGQLAQAETDLNSALAFAKQQHLLADHSCESLFRMQAELAIWQGDDEAAKAALALATRQDKPLGDYWSLAHMTPQLVLNVLSGTAYAALEMELEQRLKNDLICRNWRHRAQTSLQLSYIWSNQENKLAELQPSLHWHQQPAGLHDLQDNLLFARTQMLCDSVLPNGLSQLKDEWRKRGATHLANQYDWLIRYQSWRQAAAGRPSTQLIHQARQWLESNYLWDMMLLGPAALKLWQQLKRELADSADAVTNLNRLIALCTDIRPTQSGDDKFVPDSRLTRKEWQVLQRIGQGFSNEEIAAQMFVALSTVKSHVNHIYRKLDLLNRQQAKAMAAQLTRTANI